MRTHVPGIHIPDSVIARLERTQDPHREGIRMCIETIQRVRGIEGIAGIHLIAPKKEHLIQEIVKASGVLAGRPPGVDFKGAGACPSAA
jgi:methylenetetrahydrofolate reductase (NADPH)